MVVNRLYILQLNYNKLTCAYFNDDDTISCFITPLAAFLYYIYCFSPEVTTPCSRIRSMSEMPLKTDIFREMDTAQTKVPMD